MTKVFKKITALALAAVTAGALGLSAVAEVDSYDWTASKTVYQGAPSGAGNRPDSESFNYSPYGYTTTLNGTVNTKTGGTGTLTVSCTSSCAKMTPFKMIIQGQRVTHTVELTGVVRNGIEFTYTAFTELSGNTFTATGNTTVVEN